MNRGKPWDEKEESKMMEELSQRHTIEQIANMHGRSIKAIEMRIAYLLQKQKGSIPVSELARQFQLPELKMQELMEMSLSSSSSSSQTRVSSGYSEKLAFDMNKILERLDSIDHKLTKLYKSYRSSSK